MVMGEDGAEYSIELSYEDGKVEVSSEADIAINMEVVE